jgi:hypothetical protein
LPGPARALRFVLEQGLPAELEVTGGSMEPTLPRGTRVKLSSVSDRAQIEIGEILVLETDDARILITHRLMHAFVEGGGRFVIHQGDAPGAAFAVAPRENVIARVTGIVGPEPLDPSGLHRARAPRFVERRLACRAYALARVAATSTGLGSWPALRRWGERLRRLAGRLTG